MFTHHSSPFLSHSSPSCSQEQVVGLQEAPGFGNDDDERFSPDKSVS